MGSKVSSLTVSLKDDVSGKAGQIGRALKQASDQARAMAQSMTGSGASRGFTNNLSKLGLSAKEIEKVSASLKDYARSSGMAARASDWTKDQTAQIRQWEAATIASLRHVKNEQRAAANAQLEAAVQAGRARRAESLRARRDALMEQREHDRHARRHGAIGTASTVAAGYVSAHSVGHGIVDTLKAGARYQHEVVALQNAGRTPAEMHEIEHASNETTKAIPTATFSENLKVINETTGAFGSLHHAIENLPFMQKSAAVLHAAAGDKIHDGAGELGNKLARFFEMRGTAGNTEVFQKEAAEMVRAMVFTRGNFNPHEMVNFAQQAKSSLPLYSERFMSKIAPSLVTEYGGERAGTAANAFRNIIMGKANDKKQAEEWVKYGLLDPKMAIMKGGHAVSWKAGAVKDTNTALSDPLEWAEKTLLPALQKKGVQTDDKLELSKALGTMFRNSNSNLFAEALSQSLSRQRLHKDEGNISKSSTVDEAYERNLKKDPTESIKALKATIDSLMEATSGPAMETAAAGLKSLASGISAVALAAKDHPYTAMAAGGTAGVAALGGAGFLSYKLLTGFGLPASATALTKSAAELSIAAGLLSKGAVGSTAASTAGGAAAGATAGSALAAGGVVAATAIGGAIATQIANEVSKDKDFAKPYLDNPMLGADPAGYALGAAIHQAGTPESFKRGSLPPGTAGMPGAAPERLPGLDGRKSQIAGDLKTATAEATALKTELAGVQAQLDGIKASGQAASSPETSGLEARQADLLAKVSEVETKIKALNAQPIKPQADASGLDEIDTAVDRTRTKLAEISTVPVSPQVTTGGLDALNAKIDKALSGLRQIASASSTANASIASVNAGAMRARAGTATASFSDGATSYNAA